MERNFVQELDELNHAITSCVLKWKTGYDEGGYQDFIRSLERLESTLENHFAELSADIEPLIATLRKLDQLVQNKDIMAVSDIMEYDLQPLVFAWRKGCESQ